MIKQKKPKILLVGDCLGGGGAERVQARLSVYFEEKGIEVHHAIVTDNVSYAFEGTLLNLGKKKHKGFSAFSKLHRMLILRSYIRKHSFNYIIDFRFKSKQIQEFIIARCLYRVPYIMSVRSYNTNWYFPTNKWLAKRIYKDAYGIVTVSRSIQDKIVKDYGYQKVVTIYNPVDITEIDRLSAEEVFLKEKYILAVGRMKDEIKQFDLLIEAYHQSSVYKRGVKLVLIGEGDYRSLYEKQVVDLGIEEDVLFLGHKDNPFAWMKQALFLVLTSKNEGFPNVLIEALACGTPVVSFDCYSGPSEIIINQHNGLLVSNQNQEELIKAMNQMIEDDSLYSYCKQNARISIEPFTINTIGEKWLEYLKLNNFSLV